MLIQGSEDVTEAQLLMQLRNARQDDECRDLELKDVEFEHEFVSAVIESLHSKKRWDRLKITNCYGGSIVNDVIWGICSATSTPIITFELHQTTSSIDALTFAALTYALKYAKHWKNLALAVQTIDFEAANSLARSLAMNTWLESLDLGRSVFSAAALGPLSFGLRLNRNLKKLVLDGCGLSDDQTFSILQALQEHPTLKILSLKQNACHDQGMGAIAALLHYNDLEELDMSYLVRKKREPQAQPLDEEMTTNEEERNKTDHDEDKLESGGSSEESKKEDETDDATGKTDKEPTKVDAHKCDESTDGQDDNAEVEDTHKVRNTSLRCFHLAGNFLNDQFLDSLLGIFGKASRLEELNLFGNRISDSGLQLIVRKIPHFPNLKTLWLGHNLFSVHAAKELLPVMKSNYTLQDLNIRSFDDSDMEKVQAEIDHYCRLNRGGRRIFAKDKRTIPLSLWPLVLERAHTIYWGVVTSNTSTSVHCHAADVLYCLLHGPAVFENPSILS